MPFDGLVLASVVCELNQTIIGSRIDKIYQPKKEEIHLLMNTPKGKLRLLLCANAFMPRVHWTFMPKENPTSPPVFCMVLRKHLEGGRILAVKQIGLDRVLHIEIDTKDELGQKAKKTLICEIMGKHSNIILINEKKEILDGIRRYNHTLSRYREVLPGRIYLNPPPQNKRSVLEMEEEEFCQILLNNPLEQKTAKIIQKEFDGLSPLMAKEIIHRAGIDFKTPLELCGIHELRSIYLSLRQIMQQAKENIFNPCLVRENSKHLLDFSAFNLTFYADKEIITGQMNDLLDKYYQEKQTEEELRQKKQAITTVISREIGRLEKKFHLQKESILKAENKEEYKVAGNLITANIYKLKKGDTVALVENYYEEGSPLCEIPLKPQFTPSENAQWQYKKYNKAKFTLEKAQIQAKLSHDELIYLLGVESSLNLAENLNEVNQIRQELIKEKYLKSNEKPNKVKKVKEKPRPLRFTSSSGLTIWVGKNNQQNDYLTLKMAKEQDIWLHTKDIPGSHVIISLENKELDDLSLEQAAILAAYFSKSQNSTKVPVDYTFKKYVQKPSGAKPGLVIYTNQKTIYVNPQEELVDKLKAPLEN